MSLMFVNTGTVAVSIISALRLPATHCMPCISFWIHLQLTRPLSSVRCTAQTGGMNLFSALPASAKHGLM